ncbi:acetylxylan esterase [Pseudopedobacter beijingensis]|uniref:Acetylxylan esterase n=1 Tax=Pseudopedobacter beijingensis TaxID=1207056 RepID=A0ABW4IAZ3_9SPHI
MRKLMFFVILCMLGLSFLNTAYSQQPDSKASVQIRIEPNHTNSLYKMGEVVSFKVTVLFKERPAKNAEIYYEIGPEKMKPMLSGKSSTKGTIILQGGTLDQPGFLRCVVTTTMDGVTYRNLATVGFEPSQIKAVAKMPEDFLDFWNSSILASEKIAMDPVFTPLPERNTDKVNVYQVSVNNYMPGNKVYGILCIPKKEGKYPAIIKFPGAGVWPLYGEPNLAEQGVITLDIGIHGIPLTLDPALYSALNAGALNGYFMYNLEDKNKYYHKRVFLGCIRAVDLIFQLPEFDGSRLAVCGGSQGGALAIATAALDKRVNCVAALYPALCDLTGYLHQRAGGAPQIVYPEYINDPIQQKKIETAGYYDTVNFARILKIPGFYLWGFNDEACAPTSTYAAYNEIQSPKELFPDPRLGHWSAPDQWEKVNNWIFRQFNNNTH